MKFLAKQLPYLRDDGVQSSWHFSNMFSIIDSKERVSFYCVQSQIFPEWRKKKKYVVNSVSFTYGSTSHGLRLKEPKPSII